jgi:glycosyltransferase involved in cell wall biosynthesis
MLAKDITGDQMQERNSIVDRAKVSVVIPAFNAERTISETLASVRNQTHANLEIILVDDGSKDRTLVIARAHAEDDPRIRIIEQQNAGVAAARNTGVATSTGEFIAPLDADDLWHPTKIERQLEVFEKEGPDTRLVYTWFALLDEDSNVLQIRAGGRYRGRVLQNLAFYNFIGNGSSPLIRRSVFEATPGFDASLKQRGGQGCEDWKLYFQLAKHCNFGVVPAPLTGYRLLPGNMSSDVVQMLRSRDLAIADLMQTDPEYRSIFREGRNRLSRSLFHRALRQGRPRDILSMTREIAVHDPWFLAKVLTSLPVAATRGIAGRLFGMGHFRRKRSLPFTRLDQANVITSFAPEWPQDRKAD